MFDITISLWFLSINIIKDLSIPKSRRTFYIGTVVWFRCRKISLVAKISNFEFETRINPTINLIF